MVRSARPIATMGGKSDHSVLAGLVILPVQAQSTPNPTTKATMSTLGMIFFAVIFLASKNKISHGEGESTVTKLEKFLKQRQNPTEKCLKSLG